MQGVKEWRCVKSEGVEVCKEGGLTHKGICVCKEWSGSV